MPAGFQISYNISLDNSIRNGKTNKQPTPLKSGLKNMNSIVKRFF